MNRRDRDPRDGTGLSSNEEDYLKTVYGLGEWSAEPVTTGALAAKLGVAPASATSMVAKLVAKGLLTHPPYGAVELTPQGRRTALVVVRRHRLLETFLVGSLGYAWDEVHDEAEVLEHTVSTRFVDRLDALLGRPAADPHGDPIPSADGRVDLPEAARWDRAAEGPVVVVRVSDADPDVLRSCAAAGIVPGAQLDGDNRPEDSRWAAAVWVVPA